MPLAWTLREYGENPERTLAGSLLTEIFPVHKFFSVGVPLGGSIGRPLTPFKATEERRGQEL